MGCGMSTEEKEGKLRNEQIESTIKRDRIMQRNEIKMLLLGNSILGILSTCSHAYEAGNYRSRRVWKVYHP